MEQFLFYALISFVVIITVYKSEISLAILLNTNLFRAIPYVDYNSPVYGYYLENDLYLGAILPASCFSIILLKLIFKNKNGRLKYRFDQFDFFILLLTLVMLASIVVSPDIIASSYYTGIFLFLGAPFFFVTKLLFSNTKNLTKSLNCFFYSVVFFALIFSVISLYLHGIALYPYKRMTFPGVHPISFCLLITSAVVILTCYFIKPELKKNLSLKGRILFSLITLAVLAFSILKSNTRGPVVSMVFAFLIISMFFLKIKVKPKFLFGALAVILVGLISFIVFFDANEIASRFVNLATKDADSLTPRLIGYLESLRIFFLRPFGISVGTFGEFFTPINNSTETAQYAHNLFMELISSFGILGLMLCLLLLFLSLNEYSFIVNNQKAIFSDSMFFLTIVLFLFFFFETQISFKLNNHKGWYLLMALYSVSRQNFIKNVKIS